MLGAVMPVVRFVPGQVITVTFFIGSSLYLLGAIAQIVGEVIRSRRAHRLAEGGMASTAEGETASTADGVRVRRAGVALIGGAVQAVGAILFQTNLTAAFARDLSLVQQEILLWVPDLVGSVLFLVSSVPGLPHGTVYRQTRSGHQGAGDVA